jgi:hypothetical protein
LFHNGGTIGIWIIGIAREYGVLLSRDVLLDFAKSLSNKASFYSDIDPSSTEEPTSFEWGWKKLEKYLKTRDCIEDEHLRIHGESFANLITSRPYTADTYIIGGLSQGSLHRSDWLIKASTAARYFPNTGVLGRMWTGMRWFPNSKPIEFS